MWTVAGECAKAAESTSDQAKEGDGKSQEISSGMSSSTRWLHMEFIHYICKHPYLFSGWNWRKYRTFNTYDLKLLLVIAWPTLACKISRSSNENRLYFLCNNSGIGPPAWHTCLWWVWQADLPLSCATLPAVMNGTSLFSSTPFL